MGSARQRIAIAAACLLLAIISHGCSPHQPPPGAASQSRVPTREAFAASTTQPGVVADDWLATFSDPQLDALVEEAMRNNPDLRAAAARREEAAARTIKAGAGMVPRIDAGGGAGIGGTGGTSREEYQLGLQVRWELDVWGRMASARSASEMDQAVVNADYEFARQSLAATVAKAWFVAIGNHLQLQIEQAALASMVETERIVRAKLRAGQAKPLDLDLAQANTAQAREAVEKISGAGLESRRSLEVLLGRYPAAEIELAASLPDLPGNTPSGLPSELLERRPDMVAADRQVAAAFYRVGSAKAARLPRVQLSASLGTLLDPADAIWSLGANLLAPLWDGGERKADVAISEAQQKQALAGYVRAALNAFAEVETALSNEQVLARRHTELAAAQARLLDAQRSATRRYESGDLSIFDLNQVQRQYLAARSDRLRVRLEQLKQRVNLHLALGGSFQTVATRQPAASNN